MPSRSGRQAATGQKRTDTGEGGVDADGHRLAQLLGNLVSNALTYGDPAGTVTVTSTVVVNVAQLTVHNMGAVTPPAVLATMFDPMVRGTIAGNSSRSVGLGLFIVRAIAQAHQGKVTVASSSETGTRFTVSFPASGVAT